MKIKWIDGNSNLVDTIIKVKPYRTLQDLINTNAISFITLEWIEWNKAYGSGK